MNNITEIPMAEVLRIRTLLNSKSLYHGSTSQYFTKHGYTSLYLTLPWLNYTLPHSTLLNLSILHSYITLPWLYLSLLDSTFSTMNLLHSTWLSLIHHGSTSLYVTLHYRCLLHSIWLDTSPYLTLDISTITSTWLYIDLPRLYFTVLNSTSLYHSFTSLYITLLNTTMPLLYSILYHSTMAPLHSTWFYIILPWFYLTLL